MYLYTLKLSNNSFWVHQKLPYGTSCLVKQVEHQKLTLGTEVNRCTAIPKSKAMPIILVNTKKCNVLGKTLLKAELYDVDNEQIKGRPTVDLEEDEIKTRFYPVHTKAININTNQVEAGPIQPSNPDIE